MVDRKSISLSECGPTEYPATENCFLSHVSITDVAMPFVSLSAMYMQENLIIWNGQVFSLQCATEQSTMCNRNMHVEICMSKVFHSSLASENYSINKNIIKLFVTIFCLNVFFFFKKQ